MGSGKAGSSAGGGLNCQGISLQNGSSGDDVKTLQTGLSKMGYYTSTIDGQYGPKTVEAVKKLQAATGLTQDGWFGEKTCPEYNVR
ncbi:MAG: peptidoglycan-binding protein [Methanosphaera sp.]|nr:peptidoglycan-binding protein [Methanosphaera sp.]